MNCPACGRALSSMTVADVTVDVCRGGCGGIWFDHLELAKLDDRDEAAGEALLGVERDPAARPAAGAGPRGCPRCGHAAMSRHFYSPKRAVEVDECPRCGGFWLDAGELATIRAQYATEAERRAAHRDFAHTIFREQVAALEKELGVKAPSVLPPLPGEPRALAESEGGEGRAGQGVLDAVRRIFHFL